jgi:uncharacterized protein (TIGR02266 family)
MSHVSPSTHEGLGFGARNLRSRGSAEWAITICPQRRAHARYAVELDVNLGSDRDSYQGFVENLSTSGLFVATHLVNPVGSSIELCIHLPEGELLRGIGEVRWIRDFDEANDMPPGMGIRFMNLAPGAEDAIERFLSRRESLFGEDD